MLVDRRPQICFLKMDIKGHLPIPCGTLYSRSHRTYQSHVSGLLFTPPPPPAVQICSDRRFSIPMSAPQLRLSLFNFIPQEIPPLFVLLCWDGYSLSAVSRLALLTVTLHSIHLISGRCNLGWELMNSCLHCSIWNVAPICHSPVGTPPIMISTPPHGNHDYIPSSTPLPGLTLLCFVLHTIPQILVLHPQYELSSIPVSDPQPRFGAVLFHSMLLQHLLCTLLFPTALPIWCSTSPGGCSPFSYTYCLSNPHIDSQLANITLHLY